MEKSPPPELQALLGCYRRLLDDAFGARVLVVRLFGSRARGDARPDSDTDVAVVIAGLDEGERTLAIDLALDAWRRVGGPGISPLVWSDVEERDVLRRERRIGLEVATGIPL